MNKRVAGVLVLATLGSGCGLEGLFFIRKFDATPPPHAVINGKVSDVAEPLNGKLGQACFALGAVSGTTVGVTFSAACAQESVRGRMESAPPAGLLSAPPARSKSILKA